MAKTIFISNLNAKEFKEFLGDRLIDRMRENKIEVFTFKNKWYEKNT
jgi:DNA replication protein DnaC